MVKGIFHDSFENFEITRICMEDHVSVTGWQSCFSHTNASNFQWPLQLQLLRYATENYQLPIQF